MSYGADPIADATTVSCPLCGARRGQGCRRKRTHNCGDRIPWVLCKRPHRERVRFRDDDKRSPFLLVQSADDLPVCGRSSYGLDDPPDDGADEPACDRCGDVGLIEYSSAPELWGEDSPSEPNHMVECPACTRRLA